ncbi:MAG TPA: DUF3810 domain-containing protein [Clostridia bacterium]|nr:DUF3810 domain-containing protein [Clostridia bacterium]
MDEKSAKRKKVKNEWKQTWSLLPWLLLLPAGYGLTRLAAAYPDKTELIYSEGFYPIISSVFGKISSFLRWVSLAEILICLGALLLVLLAIFKIIGLLTGKVSVARFVGFILSVCIAASVLFDVFYINWGFNYFRPALSARMELDAEPRPVEELEALCYRLAAEAATLREEVSEDENGVFTLPEGYAAYFNQIPTAYHNLGLKEEMFARKTYAAKGVFASEGLSYAGIAGIFIPFTCEANVNVDQPALLLLSSAAHETAHYLGIAAEDEANFVAYLACKNSTIPAIQYSGVMLALINCMNKLYAADSDLYAGVHALYTPNMLQDLSDYSWYWSTFEGPVEEKVTEINDNYLKFNEQENGVKSYGMMVDLLLAYTAKNPQD